MFTWDDFKEKVNGELIGNFGNLINRTLSFVMRYYDGKIPVIDGDIETRSVSFWEEVRKMESSIEKRLNRAELRDAFREIFELSSIANKYFQDSEPWKYRDDDPKKAKTVIRDLVYIVRDLAVLVEPYMPAAAAKIASFFNLKIGENISWKDIGKISGLTDYEEGGKQSISSEILFTKLEDEQINTLRERYSGTQKERQETEKTVKTFSSIMDLRVAKIEKIERHPKADKLYIVNLETGEGVTGVREERQIVSGLVDFYTEEQLLRKKIIVAYNLKPAKLRGIESRGMLLAAGDKNGTDSNGQPAERCEVLDAGDCPTGTRFIPEGEEPLDKYEEIDIDTFFSQKITVKDHVVMNDDKRICLNGNPVRTVIIPNGEVR
jgi:methionyl-tRNA synthetase